jgi:type III secretion system FlhB-like substrate exporter
MLAKTLTFGNNRLSFPVIQNQTVMELLIHNTTNNQIPDNVYLSGTKAVIHFGYSA